MLLTALVPETSVSANSTTWAYFFAYYLTIHCFLYHAILKKDGQYPLWPALGAGDAAIKDSTDKPVYAIL